MKKKIAVLSFLIILFLGVYISHAATLGYLPGSGPVFRAFTTTGNILTAGSLVTCVPGTTCGCTSFTPQTAYYDSAGLSPAPDPIPLDATGSATVWLNGSYKLTLCDRYGNLQWTKDNIVGVFSASTSTSTSGEWIATGLSGLISGLSSTTFQVQGNYLSFFPVNERVRGTITGGSYIYGTVQSSTLTYVGGIYTFVTMVPDAGSSFTNIIDASTGIISPANSSLPIFATNNTWTGNQTIMGNINSSGSNTLSGTQNITGGIASSGTNSFSGSQTISGNINSSGTNTYSGPNFFSNVNNTFYGNVFNGNFTGPLSGNVTGNISSSGTSTFLGPIVSSGTNTFSGTQNITGGIVSSATNTLTGSQIINGGIQSHGSNIYTGNNNFQNTGVTTIGSLGTASGNGYVDFSLEAQMMIKHGTINSNGTIASGTGFTASNVSTGVYQITFSNTYGTEVSVIPAMITTSVDLVSVPTTTLGGCTINIVNLSGVPQNDSFSFIAIGH